VRFLFVALAVAVALLYFTVGLRFGYVTLTPTRLLNAQGENRYAFELYDDGRSVGVQGTCSVSGGQATLRLLDPRGTQVAGQTCARGNWSLSLLGGGQPGIYRLSVEFDRYTGVMDLKEARR
jgi:hypothetical protein